MKFNGERTEKPWGYEILWAKGQTYLGKILHINSGQKLSLQYHNLKEETVIVLSGKLTISGKVCLELSVGETFHVAPKQIHRFENTTREDLILIEVSSNYPEDVVRLEDIYKRV